MRNKNDLGLKFAEFINLHQESLRCEAKRLLLMKSMISGLLTFSFHVLNDIGELSLYSLRLIGFQERT